MVDRIEIDVTEWDESDWELISELFDDEDEGLPSDVGIDFGELSDDGDDDDDDAGFDWLQANGQIVASFEDDYGSDEILLLPSGQVLFHDRNSGMTDYTANPVDIIEFTQKLQEIIDHIKEGLMVS